MGTFLSSEAVGANGKQKKAIRGSVIMKLGKGKKQLLYYSFLFVVRLALGCMFIWSGLSKIRQPYSFLSSIYDFELTGAQFGMMVAMVLPWLEFLVGICLVGGICVNGALLVTVGMATMFAFTLASVLYRGLDISCGCFGASKEVISYFTLIRACVIFLFSAMAYICNVVPRLRPQNIE